MNDKLWLKENKNGEDLVECLKDTIKNERWFEINEENSKTLLKYIEKLQKQNKKTEINKFKGMYDTSKSVYITNTTGGLGHSKTKQIIDDLIKENTELKEKIEYYYETDEFMKKEDLDKELQPYYKNHDCCRYIVELRKENQQLKDRIELAIEYIRDCCNMYSKWTNLHFDYAQNEMSSDQADELLDLLKGDKE